MQKITNNLGTVETLNNFYEYQLYCKSLYASIQDFTKNTMEVLKQKTADEYISTIMEKNPNIQDRTTEKIFTIDSNKSIKLKNNYAPLKHNNFIKMALKNQSSIFNKLKFN